MINDPHASSSRRRDLSSARKSTSCINATSMPLKKGTPDINALTLMNSTLHQLEQFWTGYINNIYKVI